PEDIRVVRTTLSDPALRAERLSPCRAGGFELADLESCRQIDRPGTNLPIRRIGSGRLTPISLYALTATAPSGRDHGLQSARRCPRADRSQRTPVTRRRTDVGHLPGRSGYRARIEQPSFRGFPQCDDLCSTSPRPQAQPQDRYPTETNNQRSARHG